MDFQFIKGTELFIGDTLSRAFLKTNDQHPCIMTVNFSENISDICLREIRDATAVVTKMGILKSYILNG